MEFAGSTLETAFLLADERVIVDSLRWSPPGSQRGPIRDSKGFPPSARPAFPSSAWSFPATGRRSVLANGQNRSNKLVTFILADPNILGSDKDAQTIEGLIISGTKALKDHRPGALVYTPPPSVKYLDDDRFTRDELHKLLKDSHRLIDQQTTVLFYYKGHGGHAPGAHDQGRDHTLYLQGVDAPDFEVTRSELLNRVGRAESSSHRVGDRHVLAHLLCSSQGACVPSTG